MPSFKQNNINLAFSASVLFFFGSVVFTIEAVLEIIKVISLWSFVHFLACLFFTIGSLLFMYDTKK